MKKIVFHILISILILQISYEKKSCKGLALEGGGTKGAYQAGVLKGLIENLPAEEVAWDVISGVSVGAINGALLSVFPVGEEVAAFHSMIELWGNIVQENIYDDWEYGIAQGVFMKGLFNMTVESFVKSVIADNYEKLERQFSLGLVDANTGDYVTVNMNSVPFEELPTYVWGTAAMPGVFQYWEKDGFIFIDGGSTLNLDAFAAVHRCREFVDYDSEITIDILLNSPIKSEVQDMSEVHSLGMLFRYFYLNGNMKKLYFMYDAIRSHPEVNWRYIVSPTKDFPGTFVTDIVPLDFDPEHIQTMINMGVEDAINVINTTNLKTDLRNKHLEELDKHIHFRPRRVKSPNEL